MLILPTGLQDRQLRRMSVVTPCLVLVNVLVFLLSSAASARVERRVDALAGLIEQTLAERPWLDARALEAVLGDQAARDLREDAGDVTPPSAATRATQQRELDGLIADFAAALDELPTHRFGFRPAHPSVIDALTSLFMHGGWIHLLGNMLFLYVGGVHLEDVYGRLVFLALYLVSGVFAAFGHGALTHDVSSPLVGASGAIAGILGASLIRLTATRIRFVLLPVIFLPQVRVPFSLPAFVVLPLWLLQQLAEARTPGESHVAWYAHVVGFVVGSGLALTVAFLRVEARWLGRSASQDDSVRAMERALQTQDADALARGLERMLAPGDRHASAAAEILADSRWILAPAMSPRLGFAAGAFLADHGDPALADEWLGRVVDAAPADPFAMRALFRRGEIALKRGDREDALALLRQARSHPAADAGWQSRIDRLLARAAPAAPAARAAARR